MSNLNIKHCSSAAFAGPDSLSQDMVAHNANMPMVVMVHAPWCGYCKKFLPTFQAAADGMRNIVFADVAESGDHQYKEGSGKETVGKLGVRGFPTLLLFNKQGKLIPDARLDRSSLEAFVKSLQTALS